MSKLISNNQQILYFSSEEDHRQEFTAGGSFGRTTGKTDCGAGVVITPEIKVVAGWSKLLRQWQVPSYDPSCVALSVEEDGTGACQL